MLRKVKVLLATAVRLFIVTPGGVEGMQPQRPEANVFLGPKPYHPSPHVDDAHSGSVKERTWYNHIPRLASVVTGAATTGVELLRGLLQKYFWSKFEWLTGKEPPIIKEERHQQQQPLSRTKAAGNGATIIERSGADRPTGKQGAPHMKERDQQQQQLSTPKVAGIPKANKRIQDEFDRMAQSGGGHAYAMMKM